MRVFLFLFVFMAVAVSATGAPGKNTYPPGQSTETKADKKDNVKRGKKFTQPEEPVVEEPPVVEEEPVVEEPTAIEGFSLENVSNYRVYYSDITPEILEEMKLFDLVIIEALYVNPSYIEELHAAGTKVYGYLSPMEAAYWDEPLMAILEDEDYLYIDGVQQFEEDEQIGDLRESGFREALLHITQTRIVDLNLDGVFVDSTGNMTYYLSREDIGPDLVNSYVQLLKDINSRFPDLEVMQNRGFKWLEYTAPYLDSLLWEDFKSPRTNDVERYWERIDFLNSFDFDVATLSNENEEANREHSRELGWVYLYHPEGAYYNNWITPTFDETGLAQ